MFETKISHVIKRDGTIVPFTSLRITNAIYRAANATGGRDRNMAELLTQKVLKLLEKTHGDVSYPHVEQVQDAIEKTLIENGKAVTAKAFILYRNERARIRAEHKDYSKNTRQEDPIPWKKTWEALNWAIDHRVCTARQLNERVDDGSFPELVRECEESYQLDVIRSADNMLKLKDRIRIVVIAGPSSSGKTTTTRKIAQHLKNEGFEFIPFYIDNYFFDLDLHPKDEYGDYDYETPEAIDLQLLNRHLRGILEGKKVYPPHFNFKSGKREKSAGPFQLKKNQILLIDSLHGLYEPMTYGIDPASKFRIYIEPLLQLRTSDGSFMRWTDIRLLRRIIRDSRERAIEPQKTLTHWHYVRRSELRYIIPYSCTADYIINSALAYELPVLKKYLGSMFLSWKENLNTDFKERKDVIKRIERICTIFDSIYAWDDEKVIPSDALIREFIGNAI